MLRQHSNECGINTWGDRLVSYFCSQPSPRSTEMPSQHAFLEDQKIVINTGIKIYHESYS